MGEFIDNSINKASISLSRNNPVALVVGAGGFLGSHVVDKLLEKNIQVVGVDNLKCGKRENLRKAVENKNFHLIIEAAEKLELDLPRVDYLFIIASSEWDLGKILELFKETKCRCLFVSSIDLYDKENGTGDLKWLKDAESQIAKFATEFNLNARVLRLGPVYGPRMHFKVKDPLIKLINQALSGDLQKEVSLEFSSRALYVSDAVDLIVRTIFAGSTAQKIFDGILPSPIKIAEIKQVLLDPVWYESRDFAPSELPPWQTPNLEKTEKSLNWHPTTRLVTNLRETLSYFKDNEIEVPRQEEEKEPEKEREPELKKLKIEEKWDDEKRAQLEAFKGKSELRENRKAKKERRLPRFFSSLSKIYLLFVVLLIGYGLIWPSLVFGWGVFTFNYKLNEGLKDLVEGDFEQSLVNINQANDGVEAAKSVFDTFEPVRKTGLLKEQFEVGDKLVRLSSLSVSSARSTATGIGELLGSLKAITGEKAESPAAYFSNAQIELSLAGEDLSKAQALLKDQDLKKNLPGILSQRLESLSQKIGLYNNLLKQTWAMSVLLPKLTAVDGSKNYLVVLQNNMELRPTGGFIGSFAKVTFEGGKLKKLDVNDIYAIDGQLGIHVEPPAEIREDLGQKDWFLRDANWEPDFPTSARQIEWFYNKETGERVEGVVALDISAMESLLSAIGALDLADYNEKITSENLFEKAITYAETGFFPGSQAKKSFLTALTNQAFNKIFFLSQNNWPGIISSLGKSLDEKHISIYLDDSKLFSYVDSQGWMHALPRPSTQKQDRDGFEQDFLSLVEANLGANKVNYYIDRNYKLETVVGKDGDVQHRTRISYINRSPSDVFPGGKYKNRMRIYLPFGAKLTRVLWGESDMTKNVTSFVDYGRSGYSLLLELAPKEQKTLVLDYSVPIKLEFKGGKTSYRLDVIKQAGTLKDPLEWTITYPISYKVISNQTKNIGPQEQTISTDLSRDRSFEIEFQK